MDYNFISADGGLRHAYEPDISLHRYMQEVRWPEGDIDMFIYGCTERQAQEKLQVCPISCLKLHDYCTT